MPEVAGFVDYFKEFLHAPEGESGDEATAPAFKDFANGVEEAVDFSGTGGFRATRFCAAGGLQYEGVDFSGGQMRAGEGALGFEEEVPAEDDAAVFVDEFNRRGADDVPRRMQDDFNLVLALGMNFAAFKALSVELAGKDGDIAVQEEGVLSDAVFLALTFHDVDGVAEHARGKEGVWQACNNRGVRILCRHEGHGAEVIEMAMRQNNEVYGALGNGGMVG